MSETVRDPILQYCDQCGTGHGNFSDPEWNRHRCTECGAFVRQATTHEAWLFGKRMEQTILYEQGHVTVGGYTPGVHGPEYGVEGGAA